MVVLVTYPLSKSIVRVVNSDPITGSNGTWKWRTHWQPVYLRRKPEFFY